MKETEILKKRSEEYRLNRLRAKVFNKVCDKSYFNYLEQCMRSVSSVCNKVFVQSFKAKIKVFNFKFEIILILVGAHLLLQNFYAYSMQLWGPVKHFPDLKFGCTGLSSVPYLGCEWPTNVLLHRNLFKSFFPWCSLV